MEKLAPWFVGRIFASSPTGTQGDYERVMASHRQRCQQLLASGQAVRDQDGNVVIGGSKQTDTRLLKARARARLSG